MQDSSSPPVWIKKNVLDTKLVYLRTEAHSDDMRMTQDIAEGATRDGLTVVVNNFVYLEGGKAGPRYE